ncbi:MAG: M24 family metallopeptidase [Lachnospirales bacterium]
MIKTLQLKMIEENISQFIVCDPGSIYYLTGQMFHTGHRMLTLVVSCDKKPILFIHEMFPVKENNDIEVHHWKDTDNYLVDLYKVLDKTKQVVVDKYFEARFVLSLRDMGFDLPLQVGSYLIDDIRGVKSLKEIELMKNASKINDTVMELMFNYIGNFEGELKESHLREQLSTFYSDYTEDGFSFEPILCFGGNAADPHHEIDDTIVKEGDCIVLDIGCMKDNYSSDMTRTVFYKKVSDFHREIYEIVKEANERATKLIKPGVKFSEIDAAARDFITEKGYGKYFNHRLGHFIGMEVHEAGDVSAINHNVAKEGMIFSIEPGIYIKDKNIGVRIENLVVVTADGCESLNKVPMDLKIV